MAGPLAGLGVIEMAGIGPAPLAGQLLADLGAQVTVIDRARGPADPAAINRRGKRSIALDLKAAEGRALVLELIGRADVLIEGFRPGVMERLGLGPEEALGRNPRLIYGRMTGWGQDGPLARTAGHDITYLARTGVLAAIGPAERPVPPLNLVADYGGGSMFLLLGILAALWERERSGRGQVVDAAMIEGVPAMLGLLMQMRAAGLWQDGRERNLLDGGAPFYRCYRCADGGFVAVGALEPQFFAVLVERTGAPEDWRARQMDRALWPEMTEGFAAIFATRPRDAWAELFADTDGCVAPVLDFDEAAADAQMAARGVWRRRGKVLEPAPAPRFSRTPAADPPPPGAPGADGEAILAELGRSEDEIARLREAGVLR